jgi:hypothetical protein
LVYTVYGSTKEPRKSNGISHATSKSQRPQPRFARISESPAANTGVQYKYCSPIFVASALSLHVYTVLFLVLVVEPAVTQLARMQTRMIKTLCTEFWRTSSALQDQLTTFLPQCHVVTTPYRTQGSVAISRTVSLLISRSCKYSYSLHSHSVLPENPRVLAQRSRGH